MLVTRDPTRPHPASPGRSTRSFARIGLFAPVFALVFACVPDYEYGERPPRILDDGPTPTHDAGLPGQDPPPGPTGPTPTWWQDVEPLIRGQCHLCHGSMPLYGAPMPLATYAEVHAPARSDPSKRVHEVVAERIARNTGRPPMPPVANGHLTDEEIALIQAWSAAGAPEGTPPSEEPKPDAGVIVDGGSSPPDSGVEPGPDPEAPFEMIPVVAPNAAVRGGATDEYGCFRTVIDTNVPLHAVEITPVIDEPTVLHHILLFRDGGRNYPEERTGFLCAADTVLQNDWELLHGWAPGGQTMVLPPEAGVRLENGDHLVVQVHYNNPTNDTYLDASGMMFKATRRLRPNDAAVLGVGLENFSLPPGQPAVERSGDCQLERPMHVFSYSPHMHLLGKGARMEVVRNGTPQLIADVPTFAFESQVSYPANWDFNAGDTLRATCIWDTTPRTGTTRFGEGTTDEMCYLFIAHYPPFGEYSCGN